MIGERVVKINSYSANPNLNYEFQTVTTPPNKLGGVIVDDTTLFYIFRE